MGIYVYVGTYYFMMMTGRGFLRPSLWFLRVLGVVGCGLCVVGCGVVCMFRLAASFVVGSGFGLGLCGVLSFVVVFFVCVLFVCCCSGFKQLYIP